MKAEIICINTDTENNAQLLSCNRFSGKLALIGIDTSFLTFTSNEPSNVLRAIHTAAERSTLVFIFNGIGADNVGKNVLCDYLKCHTGKNREYGESYIRFCKQHNIDYRENAADTSIIPDAALPLPFIDGIFNGFTLHSSDHLFIVLPAIHTDNENDITESVICFLSKSSNYYFSSVTLKTFGCDEKYITDLAQKICKRSSVKIFTHKEDCGFSIELACCKNSQDQADEICQNTILKFKDALGLNIYEIGKRTLSQVTVNSLKNAGLKVATAESCTGGLLSEELTSISGASDVLEIGICAYSGRIKNEALNVPQTILDKYGSISKECAAYLAKGIKDISGSNLGVGITGVAGPSPSEGKDVGTVFVALYDGTNYWIRSLNLPSNSTRIQIRDFASKTGLDLIRRYISFLPDVMPGNCTKEDLFTIDKQPDFASDNGISSKEDSISINSEDSFLPFFINDNFSEIEEAVVVNTDNTNKSESFYDSFFESDSIEEESPKEIVDSPKVRTKKAVSDSKKAKSVISKLFSKENFLYFGKNDSTSARILKIIVTAIVIFILIVAIVMTSYFSSTYSNLSLIKDAKETFSNSLDHFNVLSTQNTDYRAWINIDNTDFSYPVYQSTDNSFYVNHNMAKKSSRYGAIFADSSAVIGGESATKNLILFGQNISDGSMFGFLENYKTLEFYKDNPIITLTTQNSSDDYVIFNVMIMNSDPADDNGYFFPFTTTSFYDSKIFDNWYAELKSRNLYVNNIQCNINDSFLTLVTQCDDFSGARLVVMAKKLISTDNGSIHITVNASSRYPKAWYDERGLTYPF